MNKELLHKLLEDMRQFADIDRRIELCYNKDKEPSQDMLDEYCKTTELALQTLEKYDEDLYNEYCNQGTIGNEIELFADVLKYVIESEV